MKIYKSPWTICPSMKTQTNETLLQNLIIQNQSSKNVDFKTQGSGTFLFQDGVIQSYTSQNITIIPSFTFMIKFDTPVAQISIHKEGDRQPFVFNKLEQNLSFVITDQDLQLVPFDFSKTIEGYPCVVNNINLLGLPLRYVGNQQAIVGDIPDLFAEDVSILNYYAILQNPTSPSEYIFKLNIIPTDNKCWKSEWLIYGKTEVFNTFLNKYVSDQFLQGNSVSYRYYLPK